MYDAKSFGKNAELIAANFLKKKGYTILDRNWRYSHLEVDIIAQKEDVIIIVEVKARKNNYTSFEEIVSIKKQKNLINAAEKYLEINDLENELRFDVILVIQQRGKIKIEHIENAFYSML